jgi:hypothetical protein
MIKNLNKPDSGRPVVWRSWIPLALVTAGQARQGPISCLFSLIVVYFSIKIIVITSANSNHILVVE